MRLEATLRCTYFAVMKNGGKARKAASLSRMELGRHIVADPGICHGKPTFKGTRVMVWQVLEDVAEGRSWDFICNVRWGGRIPLEAVAEAVRLARRAWLNDRGQLQAGLSPRETALAVA